MDLKKYRLLFILGLIIFILAALFFLSPNRSARLERLSLTPQTRALLNDFVPKEMLAKEQSTTIQQAPTLMVDEYNLAAPLPKPFGADRLYTLKDFNREEAIALARKLITERISIKELGRELLIEDAEKQDRRIIIDPVTGAFTYISKAEQPIFPYLGRTNPAGVVARYLRQLGIIDETIAATAYYRRTDKPKQIFIEFHRLWVQNIPLLNLAGSLNSPSSLDNLSLTSLDNRQAQDRRIVETSDGQDGKVRNNIFNTLTAVVTESGQLVSLYSSIPSLASFEMLENLGLTLLSPTEIVNELTAKGDYFSYALPNTTASWENLFPKNEARLSKATITSIALAYAGKPTGVKQKYLQPVYTIRAEGTVVDGTRVSFTQTVPAIETQTKAALVKTSHAQEGTVPGKGIQIGTFELTPQPTISESLTAQPTPLPLRHPNALPLLPPPATCQAKDLRNGNVFTPSDQFLVDGIGTLVLFRNTPRIARYTFFLSPTPYLFIDAPINTTIDGVEISPPCLIMSTT